MKVFIIIVTLIFFKTNAFAEKTINISVLANFGEKKALQSWSPTITYLEQKLPQYRFRLLPITFGHIGELKTLIDQNKIDYIITNPAVYVDLELSSGISKILTLVKQKDISKFGSVFIVSAKSDIKKLSDIRGHSLAAVNKIGFGGWLIGYDELLQNGSDPHTVCSRIEFLGTQNNVVQAVLNGKADIGIIRTGVYEDFIRRKLISLNTLRIIHKRTDTNFPLIHSTDLYPEWAFAETKHIDHTISKEIAAVLLSLPAGSKVAKSADYWEWTTPYDYQPVHKLMKKLHVGAYKNYGKVSVAKVVAAYQIEIILFILFLLFVAIYFLFVIFNKNKTLLRETKNKEKAYKEIEFMVYHDDLTGLSNRKHLYQNASKWTKKGSKEFSVIFLDLDNFKYLNDTFGHRYGDAILQKVSKRLEHFVSQEGIVARQGGDEFIIILNSIDIEYVGIFVSELIAEISRPYLIDNKELVIGASAGVAMYPYHEEDFDTLMSMADIAMYEAKKRKNSFLIYSETMKMLHQRKTVLEQELRKAVSQNELYMVYQPQIQSSGEFHGVEALLRWQNDKLGLVSPEEFIRVAEDTGLMPGIGKYVITQTLQEMYTLQKKLGKNFQLSINVSIKQLIESDFLEFLLQQIEMTEISSSYITLEITESILIEDIEYILPLLQRISDQNIKLSLDDFGTGYSSLSMLRKLPIDELKIDKSFISAMVNSQPDKALVKSIVEISRTLGFRSVAEGVEEIEQIEMLKMMGCDVFQGYYYSKPCTLEELRSFI